MSGEPVCNSSVPTWYPLQGACKKVELKSPTRQHYTILDYIIPYYQYTVPYYAERGLHHRNLQLYGITFPNEPPRRILGTMVRPHTVPPWHGPPWSLIVPFSLDRLPFRGYEFLYDLGIQNYHPLVYTWALRGEMLSCANFNLCLAVLLSALGPQASELSHAPSRCGISLFAHLHIEVNIYIYIYNDNNNDTNNNKNTNATIHK